MSFLSYLCYFCFLLNRCMRYAHEYVHYYINTATTTTGSTNAIFLTHLVSTSLLLEYLFVSPLSPSASFFCCCCSCFSSYLCSFSPVSFLASSSPAPSLACPLRRDALHPLYLSHKKHKVSS